MSRNHTQIFNSNGMRIKSTITEHNGNIYLNVEGKNNNDPAFLSNLASFDIIRDVPILEKPNEYNACISRFSINGTSIPLLICPVQIDPVNSSNINNSTFAVYMEQFGTVYKKFLQYIPTNPNSFIKRTNLNPKQDTSSYYYMIYYYQVIADMINEAFQDLYNTVVPAGTDPPIIFWDPVTQLFSIEALWNTYMSGTLPDNTVNPDPILLYVNPALSVMLNGFPQIINNLTNVQLKNTDATFTNIPTDQALRLDIRKLSSQIVQIPEVAPIYPPNYFQFTQNYVSVGNWTAFKSIVFFSNDFPGRPELIGNVGDSKIPIITDFVPNFSSPDKGRDNLKFDEQGQYRLVKMTDDKPWSRFHLRIYWRNVYDDLILIPIDYLQSFNVKFLFEPVSYASNDYHHDL